MTPLFHTLLTLLLLSGQGTVGYSPDWHTSQTSQQHLSASAARPLHDDLRSLYAIPTATFSAPRQNSAELAKLYPQAHLAQYQLSQLLHHVAAQSHTNAQILIPAEKSYRRTLDKINAKFAGDASLITDLARGSLVAHSIKDLLVLYHVLHDTIDLVQQKNRFSEPKESGYRDLNVLVRLPHPNMITEVQLHLHDIAQIKSGQEHKIYEQVQNIKINAHKQQRPLSEFEEQQIQQFKTFSQQLYQDAWQGYQTQAYLH